LPLSGSLKCETVTSRLLTRCWYQIFNSWIQRNIWWKRFLISNNVFFMNLQFKQITVDFFRSALYSVVDRLCCRRNQERRGFTNHPRNAEITIPRNAHRTVVSKGCYSHILPAPHYIHPRVQRFVVSASTIYLPRSWTLGFSNLIAHSRFFHLVIEIEL